MKGPDGAIQHADLAHKTGAVMLAPPSPQMGDKTPAELGGSPVTLYVYVENVDRIVRAARAAGGNVVDPPQDQFWGDRVALVIDPEGHRWCLATHVKDVAPEDMKPE